MKNEKKNQKFTVDLFDMTNEIYNDKFLWRNLKSGGQLRLKEVIISHAIEDAKTLPSSGLRASYVPYLKSIIIDEKIFNDPMRTALFLSHEFAHLVHHQLDSYERAGHPKRFYEWDAKIRELAINIACQFYPGLFRGIRW